MEQLSVIPELTEGSALVAIEALRSECATMGANDSENSRINDIVSRMQNGELTPLEAVTNVDTILNSKNDYH